MEAISRELALPLDDILSDATTVLDRYAGHDEDIVSRLRHLLYRAREIRSLIQKVGATIAPEPKRAQPRPPQRFGDARILVADADETVRRDAHLLLGRHGAVVNSARSSSGKVHSRRDQLAFAFCAISTPYTYIDQRDKKED